MEDSDALRPAAQLAVALAHCRIAVSRVGISMYAASSSDGTEPESDVLLGTGPAVHSRVPVYGCRLYSPWLWWYQIGMGGTFSRGDWF